MGNYNSKLFRLFMVETTMKIEAKSGHLCGFNVYLMIMTAQCGFVLSGNNQVNDVIAAKLGWDDDQTKLNNTIISSASIVGLIIGSALSGPMVRCGRRLCAILMCLLIIASVLPTVLYINLYCIAGGRFVYGFATSVLVTCANLILAETVPPENQTSFGITINLGIVGGIMIILVTGLPLCTMTQE